MIFVALLSLVLGVLCGRFFFGPELIGMMDQISSLALKLLMLTVGIEIGSSTGILAKMRLHSWKVILIPIGVVIGTIGGGILLGLCLGLPINISGAISAGLGWYSLSGVLLKDIAGADIGTIAFLSNIFREVIAFIVIPVVALKLNHYTAVAPGGATTMDTTLPMVTKSTSEEMAIISVMTGVILTGIVPVLVPVMYYLF